MLWKDLHTDKQVTVTCPIELNPRNIWIRVDRGHGGLREDTVYSKIKVVPSATKGVVVDCTSTEALIRFPSGIDWSTFCIWIKREMVGQWLD
jgi:hypothetical protein